MTIIVSNNDYMPFGITTGDSKKMSYSEFIDKASSDEGLDTTDTIYFDIDDMTEEIYDTIKPWIDHVKFFRYKTKPFIKEPVELVDIKETINHKNILSVQLSPGIYTEGHILVCGMIGQGKTTLLKNIAVQLLNKDVDVVYASGIPVFDKSENLVVNKSTVDVKQLAEITELFNKEMLTRFKIMEQQQVNHVNKLKDPVQSRVLIIDGLDFYMHSDDYKSVDTIKKNLSYISRYGHYTNIMLIVSCQRPSGSVISSDLKYNITNIINVGKIDSGVAELLFDQEINFNIPFGMGIYKNTKSTEKDSFNMFTIEDVKKYN